MHSYTFIWTFAQYDRALDLLVNRAHKFDHLYVYDEFGQETQYFSQVICEETTAVLLSLL